MTVARSLRSKRVSERDLLDFAVEAAWRAGRIALPHFQTGPEIELKPDASPVTIADRAAERMLREHIERTFPDDALLGEEFGEVRAGASRRWIVDPIDGTRSFVRGAPLWGVLIAVEDAGESVVGVIHFPALGETVYAARGEGCWWDGRPARVSSIDRLDRALVLTTDVETTLDRGRPPGAWDRLRRRAGMSRTWGDCYGYALVATGRAEAMLDPVLNLWDAAPISPIIEEAGGVLTDWDGRSTYRAGTLIATNAALATDVRAALTGD